MAYGIGSVKEGQGVSGSVRGIRAAECFQGDGLEQHRCPDCVHHDSLISRQDGYVNGTDVLYNNSGFLFVRCRALRPKIQFERDAKPTSPKAGVLDNLGKHPRLETAVAWIGYILASAAFTILFVIAIRMLLRK